MSKIISNDEFFPVIYDDVLSLSWKYKFDAVDINKEEEATFDLVLNDTKEIIGAITFDYFNNSGFSYIGNVGYHIESKFQNKHYATRALRLLRVLLKYNEYIGDKTLYLSIKEDNICSQKVIENNDGKLIYNGDVPSNDPVRFVAGIKRVKIYKIEV